MLFVYGMLAGAGLLALAQNVFNYRIDEFVIEYVYDPAKEVRVEDRSRLARVESETTSFGGKLP